MAAATDPKQKAKEVLEKLQKKSSVSDEDLKSLQSHVDELETAVQATHHHDHDTKMM